MRKLERRGHGVLGLNAWMGERAVKSANFIGQPDQPLQQVDRVNALVHESAAAVELPRPFPTRRLIVALRSPPLDVSAAEGQPAEASRR